MSHRKTIKVDYLARVEGEGALYVEFDGQNVADVQLKIFEPPRFFEAFLRGRRFGEAPDITARICGICPVAYQMSSVHAVEAALGVNVDGSLRELRRLLYCGEWIESHVLHIFMLHAPDFLGYPDAVRMAQDHPEVVKRALELKKIGNQIVQILGGREIHPINVRVGGFYRVPARGEMDELRERLVWARDVAAESIEWSAGLDFPKLEQDYEFVALRHPDEYPLCEGRLVSNRGLDIDVAEYEDHFEEIHVERSNALHARLKERGHYFVGPMARYALNFDKLPAGIREAARRAGLDPVCKNPFQSIIVRAIEVLYACEEAIRIIDAYEPPDAPAIETPPRKGRGHAVSEAPRGILYHRYDLDAEGLIETAKIVPPTSQNQAAIEDDLRDFISAHAALDDEELTYRCEQAIRNYDPCISCATHFLDMRVERR